MNILLLGKPGSGKGTLTQKILTDDYVQLSTGDLLRKEIELDTQLGKELGLLLKDGNFATDETVLNLVEKFINENEGKSIIFDGFPRTLNQAQECIKRGIVFDKVFEIKIDDSVVKNRVVNRRVHVNSGRIYNSVFNPPKREGFDDITNEPLLHRPDDQENVIEARLQKYKELTEPIVNYLKSNNIKIIEIDGERKSDAQVLDILYELNRKSANTTNVRKLKRVK